MKKIATPKERLLKLDARKAAEEFFQKNSLSSSDLKVFVGERLEVIRVAHLHGARGLAVCRTISEVIDCVLKKLCENFLFKNKKLLEDENFCIVALGGYGRGELCPRSDIDIMFLYGDTDESDNTKNSAIDSIMYPLWEIGYKLGHSSRTVSEAIALALEDPVTRTSMLDSRFIGGSRALYDEYLERVRKLKEKYWETHIEELLRLKTARHQKYGWVPYVQEPNVKNGVGGLRDYHTLVWICKLQFSAGGLSDVARKKIISLVEYKSMKRAYDFLLRCRNDMHYRTNRSTDLLDLESQVKVAYDLGFKEENEIRRVEEFMRRVYVSMRDIDSITKTARKRMKIILPEDIAESIGIVPEDSTRQKQIDGFEIQKGFFEAQTSDVFKQDPTRLIKIFRYCQKFGAMPSDALEILIRDSAHIINDSVRNDEETKKSFVKIMSYRGNVAPILAKMHFLNVLGEYIPEFNEINCFVQHEFYHRYTVDVHTLNTILHLDKVFNAKLDDPVYGVYNKVIADTKSPALIYFALLLHDIGKADGIKGHAEVGAELAQKILERFRFSEDEIENVVFIIRHHLSMVRFWQANDVEDEKSVERFVSMIHDEDKLRYLYVLTFCDSKGTSDDLWNSYKQSLHSMLYMGALRKLQKHESEISELYEKRKNRVLHEIFNLEERQVPDEEILEHFEYLPRNYFTYHSRDTLVLHLRMIHRYKIAQELVKNIEPPPVIEWRDDPNKSSSTVNVVMTNRAGLFYKLAGAFTATGLNILSSKALNRSDGITIDTFYVAGASGAVGNEKVKALFAKYVDKFLAGEEDTTSFKKNGNGKNEQDFSKIAMYQDEEKYVLRIVAKDRAGLLYDVGKAIFEGGFDIIFARISTENKWANDTFHLIKQESAKNVSENDLLRTLKKLL